MALPSYKSIFDEASARYLAVVDEAQQIFGTPGGWLENGTGYYLLLNPRKRAEFPEGGFPDKPELKLVEPQVIATADVLREFATFAKKSRSITYWGIAKTAFSAAREAWKKTPGWGGATKTAFVAAKTLAASQIEEKREASIVNAALRSGSFFAENQIAPSLSVKIVRAAIDANLIKIRSGFGLLSSRRVIA